MGIKDFMGGKRRETVYREIKLMIVKLKSIS